ncbi:MULTISPECIES: hypothetical protein [unclassified Streptomyces]|uniref:hypothetical protein n=1 Tax=unclassified Streptomyces TaxID=2593676 RepID=UPI000AB01E2E|nr:MULTISPECIES: hypothetical protein [unclassified Streptomyces]
MSARSAVNVDGDTTLAELDYQELIVPVELDEDLEAWMAEVPTGCCSGGGSTSVICSSSTIDKA